MFSIHALDCYLNEIINELGRCDLKYNGYSYSDSCFFLRVKMGIITREYFINVTESEDCAKELTVMIIKDVMNYLSNNG